MKNRQSFHIFFKNLFPEMQTRIMATQGILKAKKAEGKNFYYLKLYLISDFAFRIM